MSWYSDAYHWIKKQQRDNPAMSRDDLRKHCRKNYPFAQRNGHAYKAYLDAMREVFGGRKDKSSPQADMLEPEKLTATINAENKRLKRDGTKEDAINLLKAAGILTKSGNVAKPYRG